jgi:membrane protease subunit (stomatin/prohibitin family)
LQKTSAGDADSKPTMTPLQPMESMEPMKPMRPMQMRMGNMHMSMGTPPSQTERPAPEHPAPERHASEHPAPLQSGGEISPQPEISSRRFCTQCGREAAAADRFCARCGHELVPLDESAA